MPSPSIHTSLLTHSVQSVNMLPSHAPDQGGAVVLAEERGGHHSAVLGSNFHEGLLLHLLHLRGGKSESYLFNVQKPFSFLLDPINFSSF